MRDDAHPMHRMIDQLPLKVARFHAAGYERRGTIEGLQIYFHFTLFGPSLLGYPPVPFFLSFPTRRMDQDQLHQIIALWRGGPDEPLAQRTSKSTPCLGGMRLRRGPTRLPNERGSRGVIGERHRPSNPRRATSPIALLLANSGERACAGSARVPRPTRRRCGRRVVVTTR